MYTHAHVGTAAIHTGCSGTDFVAGHQEQMSQIINCTASNEVLLAGWSWEPWRGAVKMTKSILKMTAITGFQGNEESWGLPGKCVCICAGSFSLNATRQELPESFCWEWIVTKALLSNPVLHRTSVANAAACYRPASPQGSCLTQWMPFR